MRAMASRIVISESLKWRSGRERERVVLRRADGRGGKGPPAFGDQEGVTGDDDADVVVPASIASAFEVIETEFTLGILIDALGAPALLDDEHDGLVRDALEGHEVEVGGAELAVAPLADQP